MIDHNSFQRHIILLQLKRVIPNNSILDVLICDSRHIAQIRDDLRVAIREDDATVIRARTLHIGTVIKTKLN